MENFFYEDLFCSDLSDLMEALNIEENNIADLDEGWAVKVMDTNLEKIFQFDMNFIVNAITNHTDKWEERFPEECERTNEAVETAIKAGIDIEKINSLLPSIWYPADKWFLITKEDLIEFIS